MTRLLRASHFDVSGDRADLDAATAVAHVRAQRVLVLFFNHDWYLRADLSGGGVGGKVKVGARGNREMHGAGERSQLPKAVSAGIALDGQIP